jgi:predicted nucleic acid-binding protein
LRIVIDASVIVKWIIPDPDREPNTEEALQLLGDLREARVEVLQPLHWLTEVAAVLSRLRPEAAEPAIDLLDALELPSTGDVATLKRASRIAVALNHHLFDAFYHAVAFEHGGCLVTADDHYFRKAKRLGRILPLHAWAGPPTPATGRASRA